MSATVKGLAMITAAAALALVPQAAVAKKPLKAKDRGAKVERKGAKNGSAQQRCRDERKALGAAAFAAKYGKARTKGSAKAKAKAGRAAFGRCVAQTTKLIRAEREAAEQEEELAAEEAELAAEEAALDAEEAALDREDALLDGAEPPHDGRHGDADAPGAKHTADDDWDEDSDVDDDLDAGDDSDFDD